MKGDKGKWEVKMSLDVMRRGVKSSEVAGRVDVQRRGNEKMEVEA